MNVLFAPLFVYVFYDTILFSTTIRRASEVDAVPNIFLERELRTIVAAQEHCYEIRCTLECKDKSRGLQRRGRDKATGRGFLGDTREGGNFYEPAIMF